MIPASPSTWVPDRQFRWLSSVLVVVALFMLQAPDGFSWENVGKLNLNAGDNPRLIPKIQWFPLFGLGTLFLVARFRLTMAMLRHVNPFMIAAVLWIMASTLWSYDPSLTLRRSIKVLGTLVIGWGVVMICWDYGRYERVLRIGMLLFLLASLVFIAVKPAWGIHQAYENESALAGAWRGMASHKNPFGAMASVALLYWVHAWMTDREHRGLALFAIVVCAVCTIGSRSSTSLLCGVLSIGVLVAGLKTEIARRPGALFLLLGALFLVPVFWFVILNNGVPTVEQALGPLTQLLGRDLTFTGRLPLWEALLDEIPQRPILGSGYQAFWGPAGSLSDAARAKAGWISINGHNGYLDTANEIGLIGVGLVMGAIVFDIRRAVSFASLSASVFALHLAVNFYQLASNLSETMFFRTISMTFLLTTMSSFHLARISLDLELRRRTGQPLPAGAPPPRVLAHAHP